MIKCPKCKSFLGVNHIEGSQYTCVSCKHDFECENLLTSAITARLIDFLDEGIEIAKRKTRPVKEIYHKMAGAYLFCKNMLGAAWEEECDLRAMWNEDYKPILEKLLKENEEEGA